MYLNEVIPEALKLAQGAVHELRRARRAGGRGRWDAERAHIGQAARLLEAAAVLCRGYIEQTAEDDEPTGP